MISSYQRPFWISRIERCWTERPIVWLSGVRRTGKTTLARMLPDITYLNCDLPSVARQLRDPESFYRSLPAGTRLVLDEVHRLEDPSLVLKIAADEFPHVKVLATGSSTLAATRKFRDSLTGRKHTVYLPPVLWPECKAQFGAPDLDRRMLRGGLPEALLAGAVPSAFYAEWIDSYYARDIQELFGVRNRTGFLKLLHLLLRQSGGLVSYANLANECALHAPGVRAHLEAMSIAHAVFLLPPYHGGGKREIVRQPKCYAFDTGFVAFERGWEGLHDEDRGWLWEHLVLDMLRAGCREETLHYWRDKSDREIDFVVTLSGGAVAALECKMSPDAFSPGALTAFRALYPSGENYVVCPWVEPAYTTSVAGLRVTFCSPERLPFLPFGAEEQYRA